MSKNIKIKKEIRQESTLSSKCFTLGLQNVFKYLDWKETRININGRKLHHLRYTDDMVLIVTQRK